MSTLNKLLRSIRFVYKNGKFLKIFPNSTGYYLEDGTDIPLDKKHGVCANMGQQTKHSERLGEFSLLNSFKIKHSRKLLEKITGIERNYWSNLNDEEKLEIQSILMTTIPELDEVFKKYQKRIEDEAENYTSQV